MRRRFGRIKRKARPSKTTTIGRQSRVDKIRKQVMPTMYYAMFEQERSELIVAGGIGPNAYWVAGNFVRSPFNNASWTDANTPGAQGSKAIDYPARLLSVCNSNMYNYYRVYGSSIEVQIDPFQTTNANIEYTWIVQPQNSTDLQTAPSLANCILTRQKPMAKHRQITSFVTGSNSVTIGRERIIRHKAWTNLVWGVTKTAVMTEDDYSSQITIIPINPWYWMIYVFSNDKANPQTIQLNFNIRVKVRYYTRLEALSDYNTTS